jgi:hypothetical protein
LKRAVAVVYFCYNTTDILIDTADLLGRVAERRIRRRGFLFKNEFKQAKKGETR